MHLEADPCGDNTVSIEWSNPSRYPEKSENSISESLEECLVWQSEELCQLGFEKGKNEKTMQDFESSIDFTAKRLLR